MVNANKSEFYKRIDYRFERFDPVGYEKVVNEARSLYECNPDYWHSLLSNLINRASEESEILDLPVATTECWSIVDYKDWPMLDWDWVKRSCEVGTRHAASKGRWIALSTSNFCGPQFVGMWRDKDWPQEMNHVIRNAELQA